MSSLVKVKLKTQKQLEKLGYTRHVNSLFAPMRIDVHSTETRLKDNSARIIPMSVFNLLGKEIQIDTDTFREVDGVNTVQFVTKPEDYRGCRYRSNGYSCFRLPLAICNLDEEKVKKAQDQEAAQKKVLEEKAAKEKAFNEKHNSLKTLQIGSREPKYYINQEKFSFGCTDVPKKDMIALMKWVNLQLKVKKEKKT